MIGDLDRVGAGRLEDRDGDRLLVVEQRAQAVLRGVDLDARDVAQPRDHAAGVLDDDLANCSGSLRRPSTLMGSCSSPFWP